MDIDAAEALVGRPDGDRSEDPAQVVVGRLRLAAMVEDAPACTGDQVAQPEDEPASARRGGPPPLAEHLRHHLAADGPRELEVALRIGAPQLDRVEVEELAEVVIAHVVEIPADTGIALDTGLPARVVDDGISVREELGERLGVRDVGERQALGRESHSREPGVGQRPEEAADAVVVRDPAVRAERQLAAAWRRGDVDRVDCRVGDEPRDLLAEELAAAERRVEPEHRHLLLDLAVAAEDGEARTAAEPLELGDHLRRGGGTEPLVGEGVVEVREHEVLPDEDSELVAEVVEAVILVARRAGQPEHVHAGGLDPLERRPQVALVGGEGDEVGRHPERAAGENAPTVQMEIEALALDVVAGCRSRRELAEPHPAGLDADRPADVVDKELDCVQVRGSVRMRPPARHVGHRELTEPTTAGPSPSSLSGASTTPDGPVSLALIALGAPSRPRTRILIPSRPVAPSSRVRSASSSTTAPRRRSSTTGRHGPTGAGPGA